MAAKPHVTLESLTAECLKFRDARDWKAAQGTLQDLSKQFPQEKREVEKQLKSVLSARVNKAIEDKGLDELQERRRVLIGIRRPENPAVIRVRRRRIQVRGEVRRIPVNRRPVEPQNRCRERADGREGERTEA